MPKRSRGNVLTKKHISNYIPDNWEIFLGSISQKMVSQTNAQYLVIMSIRKRTPLSSKHDGIMTLLAFPSDCNKTCSIVDKQGMERLANFRKVAMPTFISKLQSVLHMNFYSKTCFVFVKKMSLSKNS